MAGVEQPTGRLSTINFTASEISGTDGPGERAIRVRGYGMPVMQSSEIHHPFLVRSERHQVGVAAYRDLAFTGMPVEAAGYVDIHRTTSDICGLGFAPPSRPPTAGAAATKYHPRRQ
jgi:hypothetical protein